MKIKFWVVCDDKGEVIKNSPNFKTQNGAYKWIGEHLSPGKYELCLIDWVGNHESPEKNMLFDVLKKVKSGFVKAINHIKGERL